jgi:hypothetical protein
LGFVSERSCLNAIDSIISTYFLTEIDKFWNRLYIVKV